MRTRANSHEKTKIDWHCLKYLIKGHCSSWLFGEIMLIWEGNKLGWKSYTNKPVSPLMGSEVPCCGSGLSGNCLLIIHFVF